MVMIKSVLRPEKVHEVMDALLEAGFSSVTKVNVAGRGKQKGLKIGETIYDELPKEMLINVVEDDDKDMVLKIIMSKAKSAGDGQFGDGKIFVQPVETAYTVRTGEEGL